jgi:chromosome segregation ATPase
MPDLIYNVKFEIDKASAEKVGQIVDTSNAQDIKILQSELDRLRATIDSLSNAQDKNTNSKNNSSNATRNEAKFINESIKKYQQLSKENTTLKNSIDLQREASKGNLAVIQKTNISAEQRIQSIKNQRNQVDSLLQSEKLSATQKEKLTALTNTLLSQEKQLEAVRNSGNKAIERSTQEAKKLAQEKEDVARATVKEDKAVEQVDNTLGGAVVAYKKTVSELKLLETELNKSIQVHGMFGEQTVKVAQKLDTKSQKVQEAGIELLRLGNKSDRTEEELTALYNTVSFGNRAMVTSAKRTREFAHSQSVMQAQMGSGIKTFAAGNQAVFSFSDLIQDSTQFSYGFATGMRAIGNNISFTAELFAYLSREAKAANQTLRQSLMASLKGVNGAVLALNLAVTVGTILLEKFGKKSKETAEDLDEANEAGDRFLQTTDALIKALQEVNVLTSPEAAKKRRLAELDIEINRLQIIEQQSQSERQRINDEIKTLKTKKEGIALSRTDTFLTESEVAAISQKNKLIKEIETKELRLAYLNSKKEERAEEINALQKEQMELGTQIRIDTQQTAKAETEALDILKKRREEGQAQVDLLKQGRDLERPSLLGDVPELDLNQARIDANKAMFDAMFKDADAYAQAQKALNTDIANTEINTRRMVLSTLSSLAGAFAQENKGIAFALLAIEKGLAIAEVIISGKKEASKANALGAFYSANPLTAPLGASYFAAAGAITANTIATVAAITAQGIGQASSISRAGGGSGSRGGGGASASSQAAGSSGIISTGTATQMDRNIGFLPARGGEFSGAEITIINTFDEEKVSEVADRGARKRQQQQVVVA